MAGDWVSRVVKDGAWKPKLGNFMDKLRRFPGSFIKKLWKIGKEDPRRIVHSLKVGVTLTLVSLLYLMEPLFEGIGQSAIWAVMTVVVVLEFTAGATLCKGVNRGYGTFLAASLAFFIEIVAQKSGKIGRAVFIGFAVFFIGAAATYLRFFPYIKKNYEYGVVIFILTFNLITVSSYRVDNILDMARQRLYTIAIGVGLCLVMSLMVFPNWSGEDLHRSAASKLESLARSIEACVNQYFQGPEVKVIGAESPKDPIVNGYKAVLDSKSIDESLALFASWEPRHPLHCYRYPYRQYVKLGAILRHFAYTIVALHGCLESEIQVSRWVLPEIPVSLEKSRRRDLSKEHILAWNEEFRRTPLSIRKLFADPCKRVAKEVAIVLFELANSVRIRRRCSSHVLTDQLQEALQALNSAIKSQPRLFLGSNHYRSVNSKFEKDAGVSLSSSKTDTSALTEWKNRKVVEQQSRDPVQKVLRPTLSKMYSKIDITSVEFSEALPFAGFASLLVETVARLELVIEEVEELGRAADFRECAGEPCEMTMTGEEDGDRNHVHVGNHLVYGADV